MMQSPLNHSRSPGAFSASEKGFYAAMRSDLYPVKPEKSERWPQWLDERAGKWTSVANKAKFGGLSLFAVLVAASIGIGAGAALAQTASDAELALADKIGAAPLEELLPSVRETFAEMGCSMTPRDEEEFAQVVTAKFAALFGHQEPLSEDAVSTVMRRTRGVSDLMLETGEVRVDKNTKIITLADCEPAQ